MNNYLLEGDNLYLIKEEISNLINNNNFKEATISKYSIEENFLDKLLEDLDTYNLFSNKKIIIVNNLELINKKLLDENKNKINNLLKYLDNPNNDNLLIFTSLKLNNTLSFIKKLKEKTNYIKIENDYKKIINNELKNYKISNNDIEYLIEICNEDVNKLINECEKLKQYTLEKKEITRDDIEKLVIKTIKEEKNLVFDFTRYLLENNKRKSIEIYRELLKEGYDSISIVGLIATNLRTLLRIKVMESINYSRKDIAKKLDKKEFFIQKQQELTRLYNINDIIKYIKNLQEIDLKCKSTDINSDILLEMYIINMK